VQHGSTIGYFGWEVKSRVVLHALIVSFQAKQYYFQGTNKKDFK